MFSNQFNMQNIYIYSFRISKFNRVLIFFVFALLFDGFSGVDFQRMSVRSEPNVGALALSLAYSAIIIPIINRISFKIFCRDINTKNKPKVQML